MYTTYGTSYISIIVAIARARIRDIGSLYGSGEYFQKRIAIEAGVSGLWWKYVGDKGQVIGIDRFGISAPGDVVMKELSMTPEAIVKAAE